MVVDLELSQSRWNELIERALAAASGDPARAGAADAVVAAMAQHLTAPVRATLLATQASQGVLMRCSVVEDRVLVIAQRIVEVDGQTALVDDARLAFARTAELWPILSSYLPSLAALTAPRGAVPEASPGPPISLLDPIWASEEASLHVRVEAWHRGQEKPSVVWVRLWSVLAGQLYDIQQRAGLFVGVARSAGSVADEFAWALAGAWDAAGGRFDGKDSHHSGQTA